eukprot:TRINITY_DN20313_c0_g1_i1.p1 TRINITY_DN20313_c0_g1~~TRINITY_DN20313_c0_g1_i1.p1  ORF type:complete len:656 (+),score=187.93 TRINITY_DN20313_c0_g1_i1:172-2139(+)
MSDEALASLPDDAVRAKLNELLASLRERLPRYTEYSAHSLDVWFAEVRSAVDEYCTRKTVMSGASTAHHAPQPPPGAPSAGRPKGSGTLTAATGCVALSHATELVARVLQKQIQLVADVGALAALPVGDAATQGVVAALVPGKVRRHEEPPGRPDAARQLTPDEAEAWKEMLETARASAHNMATLKAQIEGAHAGGVDLPGVLEPLWDILSVLGAGVAAAPVVLEQVEPVGEALQAAMDRCGETKGRGIQAWHDGETALGEMLSAEELQGISDVVHLLDTRRGIVDKVNAALAAAYGPVYDVLNAALAQCDATKSFHTERRYAVDKEMRALHQSIPDAEQRDAARCEEHFAAQTAATLAIRAHETTLRERWGPLYRNRFALEAAAAAAEYSAMVTEWADAVESAVRRAESFAAGSAEHRQALGAATQRVQHLRGESATSELSVVAVCYIEQAASGLCRAARGVYEASRRACAALTLGTDKLLYVYTRRGYCLQYLRVYRLTARLDHLRQQEQRAAAQLEHCIETFDAMAKKHAMDRRRLADDMALLQAEWQVADERLLALEADVNNAVMYLAAAHGLEALHPKDEMEAVVVTRREGLLRLREEAARTPHDVAVEERQALQAAARERKAGRSPMVSPARPRSPPVGVPAATTQSVL